MCLCVHQFLAPVLFSFSFMDSASFILKFILEYVYLFISMVGWLGMIFHTDSDFFLVTQVESHRDDILLL